MASQLVSREVTFPGKACELKAYVAHQSEGGARPAVIVVQEWWGLDDHIRDVTRRLAQEGYFAVAPDLYSRQGNKVTKDPNVAGELMSKLDKAEGIDDLLSTVAWIKTQKEANAARIGVIGFCMGGSYAMLLPCVSKDLKAAAPFYGEVPPDDRLRELNCPVFYAYGENDGWITRADVDRLRTALKTFSKPGEVKTYKGCAHGFFNDTRKDVYAPAEARDAWQKSLALFKQNLAG
jgi:carboxymethylenebutenolidase